MNKLHRSLGEPFHGRRGPLLSQRAFTLIELLTVVGIIAILAAFLTPAITSARKAAQKAKCLSNLRQISIAAQKYASDNNGFLPPRNTGGGGYTYWPVWLFEEASNAPAINKTLLCPTIYAEGTNSYMTQKTLLNADRPFTYGVNINVAGRYSGATNNNGYNPVPSNLPSIQYPAKTSLYTECRTGGGFIFEYRDKASGERFLYPHQGINNFSFVDGHVESLRIDQIPDDRNHVFWTGDIGK